MVTLSKGTAPVRIAADLAIMLGDLARYDRQFAASVFLDPLVRRAVVRAHKKLPAAVRRLTKKGRVTG